MFNQVCAFSISAIFERVFDLCTLSAYRLDVNAISHILAIFVQKNDVLMSKRPHVTEKSALHAFGSRMIVLCIVSWCMLYLSYRRTTASSTITPWTVNTHMHLLRIDHHLTTPQSLCAEMASELRFAIRCGSRQRPAAKSRNSAAAGPCGRCSPRCSRRRTRHCSSEHEETTYIPSIEIPRLNGVSLVPHDGHATLQSASSRIIFIAFFIAYLSLTSYLQFYFETITTV